MEFEKYHKIKIIGDEENKRMFDSPDDEIIVEEKIDGGNFRFMFKDGKIVMGSRTRILDEDNKNLKNFKRCMDFIRKQIGDVVLPGSYIVYGECCIKHTMSYDWDKIPPFLGFDIKKIDDDQNYYLDYDSKKEIFDILHLPRVPAIKRCKAKDITFPITDDNVPKSEYCSASAKDQQAEGIVFKNYDKQLFSKYVRAKFKEANRKAFGGGKKEARAEGDEALIVAKYCLNPRIDKAIFNLIHHGEKLELKLMSRLPGIVVKDLYEEHWQDICMSNYKIDFRLLRKKITNRCLVVLQTMIQNNLIGSR